MSTEKEKTKNYWLESSAYDFETGKCLITTKRYPYALFFAHLALEKILKAIIIDKTGEHAPYSHSLIYLVKVSGISITDDQADQLAEYMDFHIESRYPDDKRSFYKKCTEKFTVSKFAEMENLYKWLVKKLSV